jgi:hypothetical protein
MGSRLVISSQNYDKRGAATMTGFTESTVEEAVLESTEELDHAVLHGPEMARPAVKERQRIASMHTRSPLPREKS